MFLFSCKKDFKQELQKPNSPNLEVKNGIIAFKDSKSFENAMSYFHTIGIEETHKIIRQLPNFKGLIEITPNDKDDIARLNKALWKLEEQEIQLMEIVDDVPPAEALTYDDYLIHDPYYEAILNTYREVMVSELIIRSTENGIFAYVEAGRNNFDAQYETPVFNQALSGVYTTDDINGFVDMQVVLPEIYLINRDIELFNHHPPVVLSTSCNLSGILAKNAFGQQQDCNIDLDNRRRIRATVWAQNLGVYSSIGMKTRRQTRFLGIWWNTNAERISVEGEGYYSTKWPSGLVYTDYPYNRTNTRIDRTNITKVISPLPQSWHTGDFGIKDGKPTFKPSKKYEYKKHESDHAGWHNGNRQSRKIKHN
jgi:hypothetical protein